MSTDLYGTARWKFIRSRQLQREPLCTFCLALGRKEPATVCDHVIPHRGSEKLFFDEENFQSLCSGCHSSVKQSFEKSGGTLRGNDAKGLPLDSRHPWLLELFNE